LVSWFSAGTGGAEEGHNILIVTWKRANAAYHDERNDGCDDVNPAFMRGGVHFFLLLSIWFYQSILLSTLSLIQLIRLQLYLGGWTKQLTCSVYENPGRFAILGFISLDKA
jgi:hypothetical protein